MRSGSTWTEAELSTVSLIALKPTQQPGEARQREAQQAEVEKLLHVAGIEHRDHRGLEHLLALVRQWSRTAQPWSSPASAITPPCGEVPAALACFSTSDRAVDARALAVPDAEHAIDLGAGEQVDLLRAPHRGRGEVLVEAGLEVDVVLLERDCFACHSALS